MPCYQCAQCVQLVDHYITSDTPRSVQSDVCNLAWLLHKVLQSTTVILFSWHLFLCMWLMHICDSGWMSSLIDIWRNCHHAELVFVFVFMFAVGLHQ